MRLDDDYLRIYRMPGTRIAIRIVYLFIVAFSIVLNLGYEHDHGSVPVLLSLACAVALLVAIIWDRRVAVHIGLEESPDGYIDRNSIGGHLIRWQDIDSFAHRKRGTLDQVYAVLREGSARPIVGLQEGQRVVWEGGETRSITAILNKRLHARRPTAASASDHPP
jgi:hypothetical protein